MKSRSGGQWTCNAFDALITCHSYSAIDILVFEHVNGLWILEILTMYDNVYAICLNIENICMECTLYESERWTMGLS